MKVATALVSGDESAELAPPTRPTVAAAPRTADNEQAFAVYFDCDKIGTVVVNHSGGFQAFNTQFAFLGGYLTLGDAANAIADQENWKNIRRR